MLHTYFLGILLVVGSGYASLYDYHSDVIDLTPDNFERLVTNSDEVWLVEFYAPWCGHCKNLVPEYAKAAKALRGIVKVGAVNADKYKSFGKSYGVSGFPTIKFFTGSKHVPFKGSRTADGLVDAALKAIKTRAYERLGKRPEDSGSDKQPTPNAFGHNIPWKKANRNTSETSPPPTLGDQQLNNILDTCLPDFKTDVNQQQTTTKIARMKEALKTSVHKKKTITKVSVNTTTKTDVNQQQTTTKIITRMKKALKTSVNKKKTITKVYVKTTTTKVPVKTTTTKVPVKTTTTKVPVKKTTTNAPTKTTRMRIHDKFKKLQMQLFRGDIKGEEKAKIIKALMRLKNVLQNKGVLYANAPVIKRRRSYKRQGR